MTSDLKVKLAEAENDLKVLLADSAQHGYFIRQSTIDYKLDKITQLKILIDAQEKARAKSQRMANRRK